MKFEKSISSLKNLNALGILRQTVQCGGYDLISCHTSLASFFTRMAVLGMRRRPLVSCTVHGYLFDDESSPGRRLLLSGAERLSAPVTDLLMTMNEWDTRYASGHRLGKRIVKIPGMGVDFARLEAGIPDKAAARRRLGLPEEPFLLIYPAEFSERKSHSVLLRAMAELPGNVGLLLPGEGALREKCMALAEQLELNGRVVFPGQVSDMAAWYAAADAAVSPSRSEGLPFNVMEAMHLGLPVVASAVKGHTDLIRHGENGFLFPYGDSAACAGRIRTLADNRTLVDEMGAAAALSAQRLDLSLVLPQVMDCYRGLGCFEQKPALSIP